jgi:hypothetical protein
VGTSDDSEYSPRYATAEDVPLGSYDYPTEDKLAAIERAEGRLEADINDGKELTNPKPIHADAVENLSTYRLLRPSTGPTEARYGDAAEYGENQLDYLNTYLEEYQRIIKSINAASPDEIEGGDDTTDDEGGRRGTKRTYTTHRRGEYRDDDPNIQ